MSREQVVNDGQSRVLVIPKNNGPKIDLNYESNCSRGMLGPSQGPSQGLPNNLSKVDRIWYNLFVLYNLIGKYLLICSLDLLEIS